MSLVVLFIGFSVIGLKFGFAEGCRVQMTPRLIIARASPQQLGPILPSFGRLRYCRSRSSASDTDVRAAAVRERRLWSEAPPAGQTPELHAECK